MAEKYSGNNSAHKIRGHALADYGPVAGNPVAKMAVTNTAVQQYVVIHWFTDYYLNQWQGILWQRNTVTSTAL